MASEGEKLKPLGMKSYGSIPHLIGSRRGPGDVGVNEGQQRIATERTRDRHDTVYVQEKLDGSNTAVAKVGGEVAPLGRAGYRAETSRFLQHKLFARWVYEYQDLFLRLLHEGERVVGEWLAQAHGTRYDLRARAPYVAFDLMTGTERVPYQEASERLSAAGLATPALLHEGGAISVEDALTALGPYGRYGALDPAEGAVWRVERLGKVDFLAKYVRPDKVDGRYLPELNGGEPVWNWLPEEMERSAPKG